MSNDVLQVAIVGVSGFAGAELARLISEHPRLSLRAAVADRWQGQALGQRVRLRSSCPEAALVVRPMSEVLDACRGADAVLLATPNEASLDLAPRLLDQGSRVVDLSGAFRLRDAAAYPRWYGFSHTAPSLLAEARYDIPEVPGVAGDAPDIRNCRLLANPGCYPTATIVALAPLFARGLLSPRVFVDGKSGVTGAGRKVEERLLFTEVDENVGAYRVGNHQHVPEIEQALSRIAGEPVEVTFTPHLLPVRRGLLITAFATLRDGASPADVASAQRAAYEATPLVHAVSPNDATIARVACTADAAVAAHADPDRRSVVAFGVIDNLLKGAASQALQNLCAMFGEPFDP